MLPGGEGNRDKGRQATRQEGVQPKFVLKVALGVLLNLAKGVGMKWVLFYLVLLFLVLAFNHGGALGRKREEREMKEFFEDYPEFLLDGDEELGWYDYSDASACEACEDILYEDDAYVSFPDELSDEAIFICEYCLNPKLK